jgi:hypothetical protein
MKLFLILFILFNVPLLFSKEPNHLALSTNSCKQKDLSVKARYFPDLRLIELSTTQDLKKFKILNVRGLDSVSISDFDSLSVDDFFTSQKLTFRVEVDKNPGLGYIVLDIEYILNDLKTKNSIMVAYGEISREQISNRRKMLKKPPVRNSKASDKTSKKVHVLKLE